MIIYVKTPEEIMKLREGTEYTFNCKNCGNSVTKKRPHGRDRVKNALKMLCKPCLSIESNRERYGTDYPAQNKEIYAKVKETNRKKYGCENVIQSKEVREKIEETNLRKYGAKHHWQSPEIREKIKRTFEDKYGSEYIGGSKEIQEKIKATNNAKYGVDNPLLVPEIREKIRQTMIDRYDVPYSGMNKELFEKTKATKKRLYDDEYYNNHEKMIQTSLAKYDVEELLSAPEIREKIEATNNAKYGVKTTLLVPEVQEKIKQTNLNTYGVENPLQSPEVQEKMKQSMLDKYGVDHPSKSPEIYEKAKQAFIDKYGVDNPLKSPEVREKIKQSMMDKYGVDCMFKHPDVIKYSQKLNSRRYTYDNENFDSSWEMALWIYAKDHGEPIERNEEPFEYYVGDKKHYYFPDFKYKGELIEVKGSQFMNNGIMVNPYDPSQDELFAAKQQCAIDNNVRFMFAEDLQFYIDYARNKFGGSSQWYNQFTTVPLPDIKPPQWTPVIPLMPMYIYPTIPMVLPWWMFMTPCDFHPYTTTNVFEREGMEFVDCD